MAYDIDKLYKDIQSNNIPKLLFIYGEEEYPIDIILDAIVSKINLPEINIIKFNTIDIENIKNSIATPPIMSDYRLVIIDANLLKAFKGNEEELESLFDRLPDYIRVILKPSEVDKKLKSYKRIEKIATVVVSNKRTKAKLKTWILSQFKKLGIRINNDAVDLLAEIGAKTNMYEISGAIKYFGSLDKNEISILDIQNRFEIEPETNFFELYKVFGTNRLYSYIRKMLDLNESPIKLLFSMGNFIRNIYKFKKLKLEKYDDSYIQNLLGFSSFMDKKVRSIEPVYSMESLSKLIECLEQADILMKSSSASQESLLEQFTIECIKSSSTNK